MQTRKQQAQDLELEGHIAERSGHIVASQSASMMIRYLMDEQPRAPDGALRLVCGSACGLVFTSTTTTNHH